jgi:hypothetical protein
MFYVKLVNVLLEFGHGKLSTCPGKVMDFCRKSLPISRLLKRYVNVL